MKSTEHQGIIFEKIIFEKIDLELNREHKKEGKISVDVSFKVSRHLDESKGSLEVNLEVSLFEKSENPPMKLSILSTGYFSVKEEDKKAVLKEFAEIHALAMMLPFVRETIASLTVKAGFPPLLLPPLNIYALISGTKTKEKNVN